MSEKPPRLKAVKGGRVTVRRRKPSAKTVQIVIVPSTEAGWGCVVLDDENVPVDVRLPIVVSVPEDAISYRRPPWE